jgi:hypothetical protein
MIFNHLENNIIKRNQFKRKISQNIILFITIKGQNKARFIHIIIIIANIRNLIHLIHLIQVKCHVILTIIVRKVVIIVVKVM